MKYADVEKDIFLLVSEVGVRADIPIESEEFFTAIVENFSGSPDELLSHIKSNLNYWFRHLGKKPCWLQEPEWQFSNGKPMIFIGQINVSNVSQYFQNEAAFFCFWDPETGETKTIIQIS
jgi:hypothetical protein